MGLSVLVPPSTTLLSTLARVKAELDIDDTASDGVLGDVLWRASSAIVRECGRPSFGVAQYQETLKGTGSQYLQVAGVPVLSVPALLADGTAVPTAAEDAIDGYSIEDAGAGALFRAAGFPVADFSLQWGTEAYSSRYILPGGTNVLRYTVTYTAGYLLPAQQDAEAAAPDPAILGGATPEALPGAIEQACLLTSKAWFLARQRDLAVQKQQIGATSVSYAPDARSQEGALPTAALGLLRDYRRVG